MQNNDISPDFKGSTFHDAMVLQGLLAREATPEAIKFFAEHCGNLSNYGYWFALGTCWVSYTGWSDLALWKRLFVADRPRRKTSLMKPSEVAALDRLPPKIKVYRAHRPGETEWIAYTLSLDVARRFARERGSEVIRQYEVARRDILALFLRRQENEVLVLDQTKAVPVGELRVELIE